MLGNWRRRRSFPVWVKKIVFDGMQVGKDKTYKFQNISHHIYTKGQYISYLYFLILLFLFTHLKLQSKFYSFANI